MRRLLICLVVALLAGPVAADTTGATETYDLLFKNGTLDDIPRETRLLYSREVTNSLKRETEERDSGEIELAFEETTPPQANLKFMQGDKFRSLGSFPASVGNPIIMYFVETVVRDMAESAGGSPFYIRNRVKEALVQPAEIEEAGIDLDGDTAQAQVVTLHPFADDPNRDQMKGFGDLALTVTMSESVPGWYKTLQAHVPNPDGGAPIYSSTLEFEETEGSQ